MNISRITTALVLALALFTLAQAKETDRHRGRILLAGLVVTPSSGPGAGALSDVLVEIVGTKLATKTDSNGLFIFTKAPRGDVTLRISKDGFESKTRSAKVDPDSLTPPNFTIELLPVGMSRTGNTLSGTGTLYVAYSKKIQDQSRGPGDQRLSDSDIRKRLLYSDPLDTVVNPGALYDPLIKDPSKRPTNPTTIASNHVMLYPPTAPQQSTFLQLNSSPYHLAFDASGDHLFVGNDRPEVMVYAENQEHESAGRIPLPHGGVVTCLNRSQDGRWIFASVMSSIPGILAINSSTQQAEGYLPLDGLDQAVATFVTSGPPDKLLVTVDRKDKNGSLLVVDAYTGMSLSSITVGNAPTCVSMTPDNRWAFVANSHSGHITVVDLEANKALGLINVGVGPQQCAVTPDGKRVLVTNRVSNTVSVIDVAGKRVENFIRVGQGPTGIVITADGRTAYVTNRDSGNISTLDLETLKQTHLSDSMPMSSPLDIRSETLSTKL